ncbi:MAG: DUF4429 domain-containing protein [Pseudonocardiaceae bacterium]|nr:DUF4429 domain-containing protein [Pseudonocardiaceae bacterium]
MVDITAPEGTWSFDLETVRIVPSVPSRGRESSKLRYELGELAIPLMAVASIGYEPGRKGGRIRLRLRNGADPFVQATAGRLSDASDPYQLPVGPARAAEAAHFVHEVRDSLLVWQVPDGPTDRYLLPGPDVPLTAAAGDGIATFDGSHIRLEWNLMAEDAKKSAGPRQFALHELTGAEWHPQVGLGYGYLRFRLNDGVTDRAAEHDPNCLAWGIRKEGGTTALVAAAVLARLPHPSRARDEPPASTGEPSTAAADDPDTLLRRLRELGELHRDGTLTDEEFSAAKQALLQRLS